MPRNCNLRIDAGGTFRAPIAKALKWSKAPSDGRFDRQQTGWCHGFGLFRSWKAWQGPGVAVSPSVQTKLRVIRRIIALNKPGLGDYEYNGAALYLDRDDD